MQLAFKTAGRKQRIIRFPDILRRMTISAARALTPQRVYGPLEFLLTGTTRDLVVPSHGTRHLTDFYEHYPDRLRP